jgi:hypothetical protein
MARSIPSASPLSTGMRQGQALAQPGARYRRWHDLDIAGLRRRPGGHRQCRPSRAVLEASSGSADRSSCSASDGAPRSGTSRRHTLAPWAQEPRVRFRLADTEVDSTRAVIGPPRPSSGRHGTRLTRGATSCRNGPGTHLQSGSPRNARSWGPPRLGEHAGERIRSPLAKRRCRGKFPPATTSDPNQRKSPATRGFRDMRRRGLEPPPGYPGPGPQPGNSTVIYVRCVPDRPDRPGARTIRTYRTIWMLPRMLPRAGTAGCAWRRGEP